MITTIVWFLAAVPLWLTLIWLGDIVFQLKKFDLVMAWGAFSMVTTFLVADLVVGAL